MMIEERAREVLAAEFERSGHARSAADIRRGKMPGHCTPLWMDEALAAMLELAAQARAEAVEECAQYHDGKADQAQASYDAAQKQGMGFNHPGSIVAFDHRLHAYAIRSLDNQLKG